jgi:hypothetical protein
LIFVGYFSIMDRPESKKSRPCGVTGEVIPGDKNSDKMSDVQFSDEAEAIESTENKLC